MILSFFYDKILPFLVQYKNKHIWHKTGQCMESKKNRWYDAYPELAELLEALKLLGQAEINFLLRDVKKIILDYDHELIDKTVIKYPLGIDRRWYDKDPLCWMTINALKFATPELRTLITEFLAEEMGPMLKTLTHKETGNQAKRKTLPSE